MHNWFIYKDFEQASRAAADFLENEIKRVITNNDLCRVALPGGNTPALCLELLAEKNLPWSKLHWYLGDERCCTQGSDDRNDAMLEKRFWSNLPQAMCYRIPAELGAETAADNYARDIDTFDRLDIAFLGMGEDGHTASLFPGSKALLDNRSVVAVLDSPKPPKERVSLSRGTLKKANCRVVLATGESKADIINRIKVGEALPVNTIGDINWFIDEQATGSEK
jgi:6-phosphogluconolactonase